MSVPGEQGGTKTVFCRSCKRTVEVPAPSAEGHPYGWFYLTVSVPAWFNQDSGRLYRPVGFFCSAACLAAEMPEVEEQERLMEGAYEHE
jgi:hypothetical protein